jgi:hypothetical protein
MDADVYVMIKVSEGRVHFFHGLVSSLLSLACSIHWKIGPSKARDKSKQSKPSFAQDNSPPPP